MFRKAFLFLIFILILSQATILAQDKLNSRYSLSLGLGAEKVGVPFREMVELPVHSAYYLGVERKWSALESKSGYQSIDLYLFSNYSAGLGNSIQTSYGVKISVLKRLFINPSGGIGIVHLFRPKDSYYPENGTYKLYNDTGIVRPEAHLGLKIGYALGKIDVFGLYQCGLMYRYGWDVQVLPHTFLIIGMRYGFKTQDARRKTQDARRKTQEIL